MGKAFSQITVALLVVLISACATTSHVEEKSFPEDSALRNKSIQNGDRIFIYTKDERELVMIVSSYDSTKVVGYVTSIYDKAADTYYFYDEDDGITENLQEIEVVNINKIGLNVKTTSISPAKETSNTSTAFERGYTECVVQLGGFWGGVWIIAGGEVGVGLLTTAAAAVICVPFAAGVVTTGASYEASTEASSNKDQAAYRKTEQHRFFALTRENLVRDMARGSGEYLTAMAYLEGCPVEVHDSFAKMTQRKFKLIIPQAEMDAEDMLHNLELQIAKDPLLVAKCSSVS